MEPMFKLKVTRILYVDIVIKNVCCFKCGMSSNHINRIIIRILYCCCKSPKKKIEANPTFFNQC